ncbi:DUF222 domain-containing protein [Gordonia rubripertincta]|uniref:DUF222 domain-containing protein n=1 Tax=Gordonia rubripertincta TaxID=36822 RepID=A0ABT4N1C9_GORRU|nr:DUF222 domain-containing protein [Gordonia rubripertincta]MCZ4553079.1 DUF222 domain-containing protein [Gordonia rubripertincta]
MNFGGLFEHLSMMAADTLLLAPLDDVALSEETVYALRAKNALDRLLFRFAGDLDKRGVAKTLGADSTAELLRSVQVSPAAAQRYVRVGRALGSIPSVAAYAVDGTLSGEHMSAALRPLAKPVPEPDGSPDPRSTPQRLSEGGVKPRVTMTVSAEHLLALQMNGIPGAKVPTAAATFEWTGPVSLPTAQMTVCDSVITKILLDNNGVPLEVGREFRTVTPAIRKALIARDNEPLAA